MAERPKIVYPCGWTYTVIGLNEGELRLHIKSVLKAHPTHTVAFSKTSAQGKYCSLQVDVHVKDEAERNAIFQSLKSSPSVKMIL